eukprot:7031787-Prymnesium_polylepis.1
MGACRSRSCSRARTISTSRTTPHRRAAEIAGLGAAAEIGAAGLGAVRGGAQWPDAAESVMGRAGVRNAGPRA